MRRLSAVLIFAVMGLLVLAGLAVAPAPVYALPWRPTEGPTPVVPMAIIELQAPEAPAAAWTVVQWQDSLGAWQDSQEWQGTPDAAGRVEWTVIGDDLGRGPFRWVVYRQWGGAVWSVSGVFSLPAAGGEKKIIPVAAPVVVPAAGGAPAGWGYAYDLAPEGALYTSRAKSCEQTSIAGQVLANDGHPLQGQTLRVRLVTPGGHTRWVVTGEAPAPAAWRYEFVLSVPLETGAYKLRLYALDRQPVSREITVEMQGGCERNLAWVTWMATGR